MVGGNSLVKIDDLGKPATVLIEKISAAVEGAFRPYQIKRLAKAQAEADVIKAEAQIEITELHRRAFSRFVAEEAKRQDNMENITDKAIPLLDKTAEPQKMDDDWITNFFDKCRIVSDEEMQILWARILAGEANSPGAFSKRTVNLLGSLDKTDAQLFTKLCGFTWVIGSISPLIFDEQASIYNTHRINFDTLKHLDSIGLISFEPLGGYKRLKFPKSLSVFYYGTPLIIEFKNAENNELRTGKALFTKTGEQLAKICGAKPVDGFYDYVIEKWIKEGLVLSSPIRTKNK